MVVADAAWVAGYEEDVVGCWGVGEGGKGDAVGGEVGCEGGHSGRRWEGLIQLCKRRRQPVQEQKDRQQN